MALDANIAALLTTDVTYQPSMGLSKFGANIYGAAVTLKCYPTYGARQIAKADGTDYVSSMALYFDASDSTVALFKLGDRFTAPGIAGGQAMEAIAISAADSPGPSFGAPMSAWLVEVLL